MGMSVELRAQALKLACDGNMTWLDIAKRLDQPRSTVSDFLRKSLGKGKKGRPKKGFVSYSTGGLINKIDTIIQDIEKSSSMPISERIKLKLMGGYDNSRILFISDMHIPYHHKNLIKFLTELRDRYKPTRVICVGDELDKHAMSFHDSDPDLKSAGDELKAALTVIQELYKIFPVMDIVDSNHGSMMWRKAKHHGIPRHYIKSYNEVLQVGAGWKWHHDLTLTLPNGQQVYVHHGKTKDAMKVSQSMGMNFVSGHFHEDFNIRYWANPNGIYFSMQVGCLIDDDSYAFAYNNVNLHRPIIGTGLIIDSKPVLEPMKL